MDSINIPAIEVTLSELRRIYDAEYASIVTFDTFVGYYQICGVRVTDDMKEVLTT